MICYAVVGTPHSFCAAAAPTTEIKNQSIIRVSHPKLSIPGVSTQGWWL
jgi:hypothetical protein